MADQADWGELQQNAGKINVQVDGEGKSSVEGKTGEALRKGSESKDCEQTTSPTNSAPPPKKVAGGWNDEPSNAPDPFAAPSDDTSNEGKSSDRKSRRPSRARKGETASVTDMNERQPSNRGFLAAEGDDDNIMIIPDLDDEQEEDLAFTVAEAPKNFRQVQSLNELNNAIQGIQLPQTGSSDFLDLSLLTKVLVPKDKVFEADEPWEFEQLLEEVSQAMTKEKENDEDYAKQVGIKLQNPVAKPLEYTSKSGRTRTGATRATNESKV